MLSDILKVGDRVNFPDPRDIYGELMEDLQGKAGAVTGFPEMAVGYDAYGIPAGIYRSNKYVSVELDSDGPDTCMINWMELEDRQEAERHEVA